MGTKLAQNMISSHSDWGACFLRDGVTLPTNSLRLLDPWFSACEPQRQRQELVSSQTPGFPLDPLSLQLASGGGRSEHHDTWSKVTTPFSQLLLFWNDF